ncbi:permease [Rubinisphaera sp. JC750]|uniref:permease n=1 Tax=Rubinisphaera sp. JC750 TaxID=2898658 RepID=UPI001F44F35C|nr:permease [Rubinisphaera sp. JC750]
MNEFLQHWGDASLTSLGFFWMAFWAFSLGYLISSGIQVFVTRERMQQTMGEAGPRSVGLATFFGFLSSSCSFAALATSKSLYQKGAGLVPSLAFLLASTNLVIELGIIIAIFLSWQFVVAEYLGGILLILFTWLTVRLTLPDSLERATRERVSNDEEQGEVPDWKQLIGSKEGWMKVARQYFMEWGMVWRDVAFGFTVAGIIAAFVPNSFFTTLFAGAGSSESLSFLQILQQTLVGPLAAFFTFIGSMGNIPLASILFANGVSFAGIMAFIFSDLVVFPMLRIMAQYFGWKMASYILGVFLVSLVSAALVLHYGFAAFELLPSAPGSGEQIQPQERFAVDYTLFFNLAFLGLTAFLFWLKREDAAQTNSHEHQHEHHDHGSSSSLSDKFLSGLAYASFLWLAGGLLAYGFVR